MQYLVSTTYQVPLVTEVRIIKLQITEIIDAGDWVFGGNPFTVGMISLIDGLVVKVPDWQLNLFVMYYGAFLTAQHSLLFCVYNLNHNMITIFHLDQSDIATLTDYIATA